MIIIGAFGATLYDLPNQIRFRWLIPIKSTPVLKVHEIDGSFSSIVVELNEKLDKKWKQASIIIVKENNKIVGLLAKEEIGDNPDESKTFL